MSGKPTSRRVSKSAWPGLWGPLIASVLFCLGFCGVALAQGSPAEPAIIFTLDFPGNSPPHYAMRIEADGTGAYSATEADGPYRVGFHLSAKAIAPWFEQARALHFFQGDFQSPRKVAFTGTKTLAYSGPDGSGSATFVYTEDPSLSKLTGELQQVAMTLEMGQTLEQHLRHQRMALDADLDDYEAALKAHAASHPEAIAQALQDVADSPDAMRRVSRRARALLNAATND